MDTVTHWAALQSNLETWWPHKDLSSDPKETPPRTCDSIISELLVLLTEKWGSQGARQRHYSQD